MAGLSILELALILGQQPPLLPMPSTLGEKDARIYRLAPMRLRGGLTREPCWRIPQCEQSWVDARIFGNHP
jgi:hypothetical protein